MIATVNHHSSDNMFYCQAFSYLRFLEKNLTMLHFSSYFLSYLVNSFKSLHQSIPNPGTFTKSIATVTTPGITFLMHLWPNHFVEFTYRVTIAIVEMICCLVVVINFAIFIIKSNIKKAARVLNLMTLD